MSSSAVFVADRWLNETETRPPSKVGSPYPPGKLYTHQCDLAVFIYLLRLAELLATTSRIMSFHMSRLQMCIVADAERCTSSVSTVSQITVTGLRVIWSFA